jgi:hypothetical protein
LKLDYFYLKPFKPLEKFIIDIITHYQITQFEVIVTPFTAHQENIVVTRGNDKLMLTSNRPSFRNIKMWKNRKINYKVFQTNIWNSAITEKIIEKIAEKLK